MLHRILLGLNAVNQHDEMTMRAIQLELPHPFDRPAFITYARVLVQWQIHDPIQSPTLHQAQPFHSKEFHSFIYFYLGVRAQL